MDVWFFLHVGGAMVLVGSLLLSATALVGAWRTDDAGNLRLGYRALLLGALPAFFVMRSPPSSSSRTTTRTPPGSASASASPSSRCC